MPLIVIVNYRTADLVEACLASLADDATQEPVSEPGSEPGRPRPRPTTPNTKVRVIIVDNDSNDGSADQLAAAIKNRNWTAWASVLPSGKNRGFAGGNNLAIRQALAGRTGVPPVNSAAETGETPVPPDSVPPALPDYIMLLNPDTIVYPGAIAALTSFMDDHPKVGIAGAQLEEPTGEIQPSARRQPSAWSELEVAARLGPLSRLLHRHTVRLPESSESRPCDWVSGAAMMIRREVIDQVGLMDEGYFLYYEELDYCLAAGRAGWEVWHVPAARVVHDEGSSTGVGEPRKRRGRYWYDSRRRFFIKTYGVIGLFACDALWALGRASFVVRRWLHLARGKDGSPKCFAWDLLIGDMTALMRGEVHVRRVGTAHHAPSQSFSTHKIY